MSDGKTGLQLRSLIKTSGELEIALVDVPTLHQCTARAERPA